MDSINLMERKIICPFWIDLTTHGSDSAVYYNVYKRFEICMFYFYVIYLIGFNIYRYICKNSYVYVTLHNHSYKCVTLHVDSLGSCFCFRSGRVVWTKSPSPTLWRWRCRSSLVSPRCCWAFCWVLWTMRKLTPKSDTTTTYDNVLCYYRNWIWKIIKIFNWYFRMTLLSKEVFENNVM